LDEEERMPVPESLNEHLTSSALLLHNADLDSNAVGILDLPEGPMMVAARPIITSEEEGPIKGTLIFERYLDSAEIDSLSQETHLSINMLKFMDPDLPPDFKLALSSLSEETPIFIRPLSEESIAGYTSLKDVDGKPALLIRVDMPREIYNQGLVTSRIFIYSLIVVGILFGLVALLVLERSVLSRLSHLSISVNSIGTRGGSARVSMEGDDELKDLAENINKMLEKIEVARKRAVERQSFEKFKIRGRIIYANKQSEEKMGYTKKELYS
jgi:HAMP domain-containing protein